MKQNKIERLSLLADIAEALLIEGLTQHEAAKRFGLSRPSISRLLTEARESGIVSIEIHRVLQNQDELSEEVHRIFPNANVHIASLGNLAKWERSENFYRFAANVVIDMLSPGSILGITLGSSVGRLVDELDCSEIPGLTVVQLWGATSSTNPHLDPHALVASLAQKSGANSLYFHAPYSVENREISDSLNANPANNLCIELAKKSDFAIVGLGAIDPKTASLVTGGHVDAKVHDLYERAGAVGDVAGFYVNAEGDHIQADIANFWRTGLEYRDFTKIPIRIGVAHGEFKVPIIAAALKGNLITNLITDKPTANALLNYSQKQS